MLKAHPTTAEMKHYTVEEFCADMDAILDSITKEDMLPIWTSTERSGCSCSFWLWQQGLPSFPSG